MRSTELRAIVYSRTIYQEIDLKPTGQTVCVGTTRECEIRFNAELFFEKVMLAFYFDQTTERWRAECSDNIYIRQEALLKRQSLEIENGTKFTLCYGASGGEIFQVEILFSFEQLVDFDCYFAYPQRGYLTIGGMPDCDIYIRDEMVGENYITLSQSGTQYLVNCSTSALGAYVNGTRHMQEVIIRDYDFVMLGGYSFFFKEALVYTHSSEQVSYGTLGITELQPETHTYQYPRFNRTTRITYQLPIEQLEVLDPERPQEPREENFLMSLMPALGSLALTIVLRGMIGGGGTFVLYSVCTMGLGVVVSVVNYRREKKKTREKETARVANYEQYIADKEVKIRECRMAELRVMNRMHTSLQENVEAVENFRPVLFEKDKGSEDFLTIRYGSGRVESANQVTYKPQEFANRDVLAAYPRQLSESYRFLENAPVVSKLQEKGSIGIVGSEDAQNCFLRTILLDVSIRHSFQDVKFIYIGKEDGDTISWLRWLKNNADEKNGRRWNIVNEDSKNTVLDFIYTELTQRESQKGEIIYTYYIVIVQELSVVENHPILSFMKESGKRGFSFLFCTEDREMLPYGLSEIVYVDDMGKGEIILASDGDGHQQFCYEMVPRGVAERVAWKLAGVEMEEISLESTLTRNISLYKLLDIKSATDLNLMERWNTSRVYKSMAAPMGVRAGGDIVYLDLNEKAHGPHGLVAGTTGSGKSEILQTYILSIATLFHPYEVGFVIIDFKGGGMVNQFKNLPHLVGAITNIDGKQIDRSLLSIRAELHKRQECFAKENVNHIDSYIKKYKAGQCEVPLPHLILIVDEFAELKSDQPEFMKELISTARIGRSLGVHLILATQKPSGVVNDQIWSNSKFKLCLKVQNKEDSNEVLKSPLAAEIREPGRAYFQVGNNEIFELFQSAYSGASVRSEEAGNTRTFSLSKVDYAGKRTTVFSQKPTKNLEDQETQLEAIVKYVHDYCEGKGIKSLPEICMPPLSAWITYDDRPEQSLKGDGILVPMGIFDDPEHQTQEEFTLELTSGNLFVVGSPQYGKTNLLQLIIRSVTERYSPEEVNLYILDFSSMILKNFEKLAQVSGVILATEDEKVKTFIKLMLQELRQRKELLASLGISSFAAYKEAGFHQLPQIMILVDHFAALKEMYNIYEDDILKILREGVSVGITFAVTSGQMTGMGYRYMPNFSRRIALYCNDTGDYNALFERCRMVPENVIGRGLVERNRSLYEFQSYLSFAGEKEIERVSNMRAFVERVNRKYAGRWAKQLPVIPEILTEQFLVDTFGARKRGSLRIPLGMDYDTMSLISMEFGRNPVWAISGTDKMGKTNVLRIVFAQLLEKLPKQQTRLFLLDGGKRQLQEFQERELDAVYSIDCNVITKWMEELYQEAVKRYEAYTLYGEEALAKVPFLCYFIENQEAASVLSGNAAAMKLYKELLGKYHGMKFAIIYSDVENMSIAYASPEVWKLIKENKNVIFLNELSTLKLLDVTLQQSKAVKKEVAPGDAFVFTGNELKKVKLLYVPEKSR